MRLFLKICLLANIIIVGAALSPSPLAAFPWFSVAPGSPGGLPPGDVLNPATGAPVIGGQPPPVSGLTAAALGLPAAANITGLSFGDDYPAWGPPVFYQFSVTAASPGAPWLPPGPPDNVLTQTAEGSPGADIFAGTVGLPPGALICAPGAAANTLIFDGDGISVAFGPVPGLGGLADPPPVGPNDDIDAFEASGGVDYLTALAPVPPPPPPGGLADGIPDAPVFFTVDAPTATLLPPDPISGAIVTASTVLVTDPASPTGWVIYATPLMLGLGPLDVIDALLVADSIMAGPGPGSAAPPARQFFHPMDFIGYSLAPGSPALGILPAPCPRPPGPADVWAVSPLFGFAPVAWIAAESLGLCQIPVCPFNDDLDAIDVGWGAGGAGDIDVDGLPDVIEGGPVCPGAIAGISDADGDGLQDGIEAVMGLFPPGMSCVVGASFPVPGMPDSDLDGLIDGWEIAWWTPMCPATNPSAVDTLGDFDGELAVNIVEQGQGTSPCFVDTDGDGFRDLPPTAHQAPANTSVAVDNCPNVVNPAQLNNDGNLIDLSPPKAFDDITLAQSDAMGDACDPDDDNDARSDADEAGGVGCGGAVTLPMDSDTDGDNFLDGPECTLGTSPIAVGSKPLESACGAAGDGDGDGVLTRREFCYYNTDSTVVNSDGDGCRDGREIASINANMAVDVIDLQQIASEAGAYVLPGSAVKANYDLTKNATIDVIDLQQAAAQSGVCP
jgi:hypothetical protein